MAGRIFSRLLLDVARSRSVSSFATHSQLSGPLVRRFVAGESLDAACDVASRLNRQSLQVTLDYLGENTTTEVGAHEATGIAVQTLARMSSENLDAYLSVKLSQLGLEVGDYVVLKNARAVLAAAKEQGRFVRFDMEGSLHTARIIEVFEQLHREFANAGAVIQAYLYRSEDDAKRLSGLGASIRLCKGAYDEPPHIAFRRKRDTDRNYVRIMEYLLLHGIAPAIATHDEAIIEHAQQFAERNGVTADRFEFQMLYGVRRDLQEGLARRGYRVRVYVPFGREWYPYMTRRLAERPANLFSVGSSIARERFGTLPSSRGPETTGRRPA